MAMITDFVSHTESAITAQSHHHLTILSEIQENKDIYKEKMYLEMKECHCHCQYK